MQCVILILLEDNENKEMLNNSILIDGKDAKELNKACQQYNEVNEQIKDLDKSKKQANEVIKGYCPEKGTFETTEYIIKMQAVEGNVTISAKEVESKAPDLFKQLVELDLVKIGKGYLKLGSVVKK